MATTDEKDLPTSAEQTLPTTTPGLRRRDSGRTGVHPYTCAKILWHSSCVASKWINMLFPVAPVAMAAHWALPSHPLVIFILSYIAMIPSANLLGFASQELARKLPVVFGVLLETTLGSAVELILFVVLLVTQRDKGIAVIQAAILGSVLANLLLCLGACFFIGGLNKTEQEFHGAISEVGSGLMLVAGMALVIPTAFTGAIPADRATPERLAEDVLRISRATAIVLLLAYAVYLLFHTSSHHGLYREILDEEEQRSGERPRLTLTEALLALVVALTLVALMAVFLVQQIPAVVEHHGLSDAFVGLILVPLVEKAAEHLTAVCEAMEDQMNYALSHVLGSSVQTALLNTPVIVLVAWCMGVPLTLRFELFDVVLLILAILVVGGFLRDGKSNYLEGALCMSVYVLIAIAAFFYPNPVEGEVGGE